MFIKTLCLFLIISFTLSCKHSQIAEIEKKYNQLEVGMTPEQVKSLLGDPSLREAKDGKEIWYYSQGNARDIEFKEKKVISFGVPKKEIPPENMQAPVLKDVGEKCDSDTSCLTQNCLFGRCVGKGNCWRKTGQTCSRDMDCCNGFCDFGVCKEKK